MTAVFIREKEVTSPEELQSWLEWAGGKLMSLGTKSPMPREYGSNWPSIVAERWDYAKQAERLRPAAPHSKEITLMDEVLTLPSLIKEPLPRRIVTARAMIRPVADTHLYSWAKLADMIHTDRRRVQRLHTLGLLQIIARVDAQQIYTIRKTLLALST